jgi:Fe-S cluster assembly protein SufD
MGTTRLTFPQIAPTKLNLTDENQEIEIPEGESHFHFSSSNKTSRRLHATIQFHLRHPHSTFLLTGIILAKGDSAPFLKTMVIHHAPDTQAETIIRTIAHDTSHPHYEGTIKILPQAQHVESYLNHHTLLLGDEAKVWSLPCLEIEADQVKCSHAATIQTVTDLDLFYLRSRGIPKDLAREMFIDAFTSDIAITH